MEWYYGKGEVQHGPVTLSDLRKMVRSGEITGSDKVWHPDFGGEWREARNVAELSRPMGTSAETFAAPPPTPEYQNADYGDSDTPNRDLMRKARESLRGNWGIAVLLILIIGLVTQFGGSVPCLGAVVILCVMGALEFGTARFFLDIAQGAPAKIETVFKGFSCFGNTLAAFAWRSTFIFLWSLLLVIPGIMATYSYAMLFYILAENPEMPAMEALKRSKEMMYGYRLKLLCLHCRFIGWSLLAVFLTLGIGLLWVTAYMHTSQAHFYKTVKQRV